MSITTLIIGPSGSGKTTSIRNLDPKTTFIINVLGKSLSFKGGQQAYKKIGKGIDNTGNYFQCDKWDRIIECIRFVNARRPDIKTLIIDDLHYVMANEFVRRSMEKGFDKFSEMANHIWSIIMCLNSCRDDLLAFVLSHSQADEYGISKCKTLGKLLDEKLGIEGMFTMVLHTMVEEGNFKFLTQNDGSHIAKTPLGLFENKLIDNDLELLLKPISHYYNEPIANKTEETEETQESEEQKNGI